ncbi:MAG: glycosyltransferase family 4 protein, partial [Acidimicrobiales bacterium]
MSHLLVTNDFPPKVGGIQAYLWELWRRFDPGSFAVLTARSHPDAPAFDNEQAGRGVRIERVPGRVLVPTPNLVRRIRAAARRIGAGLVLL